MKKIIYIIFFMSIIFLSGCSKEEYFICEINLYNDVQEYNLSATYKVYHEDTFVTKIEKEEIYTTGNDDTLNYFEQSKNLEYTNMNNLYGGVTHSLDLENNKIVVNATIDMSLVDVKKMIKDNYIDKNYVVSSKLTIGGIRNIYKEKGAICDI